MTILLVRSILHLDHEIEKMPGESDADALARHKDQMEDNDDLLDHVNEVCETEGPEHLALDSVEIS